MSRGRPRGKPAPSSAVAAPAPFGALTRKLGALAKLSGEEIDCLESLHRQRRLIEAGSEILGQGDRHRATMIVLEGWALRYKVLDDGRRQIVNFFLPGDIIGAFASVIDCSEHAVAAITDLSVAAFEPQSIFGLFAEFPRVGALYSWSAGRDEAIVAEQVVRIGRRSAFERTGHLLLELLRRLQLVGLAGEHSFAMPLTQELLADTLGLTPVHMSRTLRRLRATQLIDIAGRCVVIPDVRRLQEVTHFSPAYLEPGGLPAKTQAELRSV